MCFLICSEIQKFTFVFLSLHSKIEWIKECGALVADVTTPSVGVGYEIARAELLNKPVLCLFYDGSGKRLSGMVEGNKGIKTEKYKSVEELSRILKKFFEELK